ncbi:hypothetical protein GCM10010468_07910 [Actinocorallia longicatena]|uniref:Uncharacterized protein n=1 Tax=Actinocorallia longicatena TaxID=111803 RepID=A0ABP6PZ45_9ACTN
MVAEYPAGLHFHETGHVTARLAPPLGYARDTPWTAPGTENGEQFLAILTRSFGVHLDASAAQIRGGSDKAQLKRPGPGPPPESDTLDIAAHPGRQPDGTLHSLGSGYRVFGDRALRHRGASAGSAGRRRTTGS